MVKETKDGKGRECKVIEKIWIKNGQKGKKKRKITQNKLFSFEFLQTFI
jgi:hypothetical protein